MGAIQEINYRYKKKAYVRHQWVVPKELVRSMSIQKGDHFIFNGAMGNEIRLVLKRKSDIDREKILEIERSKQREIDKIKE